MGNLAMKTRTVQGGKWRKGGRKILKQPVSQVTDNGSIKDSIPNPVPSKLITDQIPSILSLNSLPSNVERDLRNQQSMPQLSDNDLTTDCAFIPTNVKPSELPQLSKNHSEHVMQEWSVSGLVSNFSDFEQIPVEQRDDLVAAVKKEAWLNYPEFFYDFCIVASDEDYSNACDLKNELCAKFYLTGCMLYEDDFFSLGRDIFAAYESMMERCTKIFFYISDNFNANGFCRRLQSGAVFQCLMSKARKQREKCVPIFPNGLCPVPLALSGIGGLEIPNVNITEQRIKITYTGNVRSQRLNLERMNNEKRKEFFLEYLHIKVKECLEGSKQQKLEGGGSFNLNVGESNHARQHLNGDPSSSQSYSPTTIFNKMQKIIETSTSAPVVSSSELNVTASSAHIGHNITVMIYPSPPGETLADSSSDSDSSD